MNSVIKELERKVEESRTALRLWKAALKAAKEAEENIESVEKETPKSQAPEEEKPTILAIVRQLLKKHERLSAKDLLSMLEKQGKVTNLNSLTVSLNRYKPHRFNRDNDGKWYLVPQDEGRSEKAN